MQTRPYNTKDGNRVWLNENEQNTLLGSVDEEPDKQIVFQLGLHGLRSDEITRVCEQHVRQINDNTHTLLIPSGKTGRREVPIDSELAKTIRMTKNIRELNSDEPLIDVSKRTFRNWIDRHQKVIDCPDLGMHDLRRTWATDTFYTLAFNGVPISEELTMSWGGWVMNDSGRQTFRENYLGPVPDKIVVKSMENGL